MVTKTILSPEELIDQGMHNSLTCQLCGKTGAGVIREQIWLQGCYQWKVWCVDTDECKARAGK